MTSQHTIPVPDIETDFAAAIREAPPKKKRLSPLSVRLSAEQRAQLEDVRARFGDMDHLPSVEEAKVLARGLSQNHAQAFDSAAKSEPPNEKASQIEISPIARRMLLRKLETL